MLTAVKCEFKEDSNINKHTHTCDEGVNAHGWMTGDGVTGCSDSGNGNHNKVLTCAAVGGWGRRRPMRLPTHIFTLTCMPTHVCGCQVPFHAQIECLSGLVGTSLGPPPYSPPEAETPHGNVFEFAFAVFAVASVSRGGIHLPVFQFLRLQVSWRTPLSISWR